jgi:hypothetical protein
MFGHLRCLRDSGSPSVVPSFQAAAGYLQPASPMSMFRIHALAINVAAVGAGTALAANLHSNHPALRDDASESSADKSLKRVTTSEI